MKSLAGFSGRNVNYFLARASVIPPMNLQVLVFPEASKEEYESKQKELEEVANPIMMKFYQANGGTEGAAHGGMPGAAPGGFPAGSTAETDGPSIEEVD